MKRLLALTILTLITAAGFADDEIFLPIHLTYTPGFPPVSNVNTSLGIGVIMNDANEIYGGQFSSVMNFVTEDVHGFQAAGVGNLVGGRVDGMQASGVFNLTQGGVNGHQYAGVFNIVEDDVQWFQGAGVFNIVDGDFYGFQGAGVFNIVDGTVRGVQAAGVFNAAERVRGTQLGVVNVAGRVSGFQLGLVNIADRVDGFSLGLVNIIKNGIFDFLYWSEQGTWSYVGLQQGSSNWYSLVYAGAPNEDVGVSAEDLNLGLGLGYRVNMYPFHLDADLSARYDAPNLVTEEDWENESLWRQSRFFPSARVSLAFDFGTFSVNAGATYDAAFHGDDAVAQLEWAGQTVDLYQKWFVGFKL